MEIVTSTLITVWDSYFIDTPINDNQSLIQVIDSTPKTVDWIQTTTLINVREYTDKIDSQNLTINVLDGTPFTKIISGMVKIPVKTVNYMSYIDVKESIKRKTTNLSHITVKLKPSVILLSMYTYLNIYTNSTKLNKEFTSIGTISVKTINENPILNGIVHINVVDTSNDSLGNNNTFATIFVKNRVPDYFSQLTDCVKVAGNVPEFEIPVRIGEWQKILSIPDNVPDKIVKIYNKPFGIQFNEKEIFGRIVVNQRYTMIVVLDTNKAFKVTLVPYMSEFVSWILNQ